MMTLTISRVSGSGHHFFERGRRYSGGLSSPFSHPMVFLGRVSNRAIRRSRCQSSISWPSIYCFADSIAALSSRQSSWTALTNWPSLPMT
jgi:hypothetical protein